MIIRQNAIALAACLAVTASMAQTPASTDTTMKPADNSKSNAPAMNSMMKQTTADGQSNSSTDITLTQKIRKSLIADKHLSTYAHNVKIVTVNGAVTLNGVVRSDHEKQVIEMKAQAIAGKDQVTNDLTIAPKT